MQDSEWCDGSLAEDQTIRSSIGAVAEFARYLHKIAGPTRF